MRGDPQGVKGLRQERGVREVFPEEASLEQSLEGRGGKAFIAGDKGRESLGRFKF